MKVFGVLLIGVTCLLCIVGKAVGQTYNQSFVPWTVMGPVKTSATGYSVLTYTGVAYDYEVYLYTIHGLKNIELHVAAPGTHGDVVAVLFASGAANASQVTNGLVAKGVLEDHDFVGPLLLPLAQHLDASFLQTRYVQTGNAVVVVHTLGNPGGELAAQIQAATDSSMGMAPMSGAAHGTGHAMSTMMAPSPAMMATTPSMPAMAGMPMGGG